MVGNGNDRRIELHVAEQEVRPSFEGAVVGHHNRHADRAVAVERASDRVIVDHIHPTHRCISLRDMR